MKNYCTELNRIKPNKYLISFILLLITCYLLPALDFGFVTSQHAGFSNNTVNETVFEYSGSFIPRLSVPIGENGNFFISGLFTLKYIDKLETFPELLRTEYSASFGFWDLFIGRFNYSDPLSIVASGLFDGAQVKHSSTMGRFGFGVWYTGFQYKNSAKILMTPEDQNNYIEALDYSNFLETYFASKRVFASVEWEHPALKEFLQVNASLIGQFDLNSADNKIHSEYLVLNFGIPAGDFFFKAGGVLQAAQTQIKGANDSFFAFAGNISALYRLPLNFNSSISLAAGYSSGDINSGINAFAPLTALPHSSIMQAKMSALTVINLNYSARFAQSIGGSFDASYFIRNDITTPNTFPYPDFAGKDGHLLGLELAAKCTWSPFSDLQIIFSGGVFIPQLGDNWKDEYLLWKVNLTAVLSLY